jgi:hypothetical protein
VVERRLPITKEKLTFIEQPDLKIMAVSLLAGPSVATVEFVPEFKDRAKGVCEGCGEKLAKKDAILGHMDHTPGGPRYNADSNLRIHCLGCEATWHLTHVGKAKEIGLSEVANESTVISRLLELVQKNKKRFVKLIETESGYFSPSLFFKLYLNEPAKIDQIFTKYNLEFPVDLDQEINNFFKKETPEFIYYYFRRKKAFDYYFKSRNLDLPVNLVDLLNELFVNDFESYLKLYLRYSLEVGKIFRQNHQKQPKIKTYLKKLAKNNQAEFKSFVLRYPEIFDLLGHKVVENLLS